MKTFSEESSLSHDLICTRGKGAFMTCLFRGNVGFHFHDRYQQLIESCRAARISVCDLDPHGLYSYIPSKLETGNHKEHIVRVIVTGGYSKDQYTPSGNPKVIVVAAPFEKARLQPLTLAIKTGAHQLTKFKITGKYCIPLILREEAQAEGFDDFVFSNPFDGITECCTANIFFVTQTNSLITPERVFEGLTRRVVLSLARQSKLFSTVEESPRCTLSLLSSCKEAFITSTTKGVAAVARIGEYHFRTGNGTLTSKLQHLYAEHMEQYFRTHGA